MQETAGDLIKRVKHDYVVFVGDVVVILAYNGYYNTYEYSETEQKFKKIRSIMI